MEGKKFVGICSDDGSRAVVNANPWEQRKVVEVAPLQRGFDLPSASMKPGKYPVVMSNGIGGYHFEYKVKGPGVVTGRSGTIGKLHYIEDDYWPHNTTLWVTEFKGNNQKFIYYLYQGLGLNRFGTGSGVPTLNRNDIHDVIVSVPPKNEQEKISSYLTTLDHLITLHQRKPIPHPNHPIIHTKHKGEEKYVRIRVNDREKTNRTANLWRFPVDIPGGFKDGGGSVGEFQIYSGAE